MRLPLGAVALLALLPALWGTAPHTACGQVTVEFTYNGIYDGVANPTPPEFDSVANSREVLLVFDVDERGSTSLDAQYVVGEGDADPAVVELVDQWDRPNGGAGSVLDPRMWGETFTIRVDGDYDGAVDVMGIRTTNGVSHLGVAAGEEDGVDDVDVGRLDNNGSERIQIRPIELPVETPRMRFESLSYADAAPDAELDLRATNILGEPLSVTHGVQAPDAPNSFGTIDLSDRQIDLFADNEVLQVSSILDAGGAGLAGFTFNFLSPADLDGDGALTAADVQLLMDNWRADTSGLSDPEQAGRGDVNRDGTVDFVDWHILRDQFAAVGAPISFSTSLTPEPSAALLALGVLAAQGVAVGGRRNRQK